MARPLTNRILLENYYLQGALEAQIDAFAEHYSYQRYHDSVQNQAPTDVYFRRSQSIIMQRERINRS